MTPAIIVARQASIDFEIHEYGHEAGSVGYGEEAATKLNLDPARVFKTLVVSLDAGGLAVGLVPVSAQLNLKHLAHALGAKKARMAKAREVQRATGYVMGGVSPLGQKKTLPTVIDESAMHYGTVFVSAGRRGLELELLATDLGALTHASFAAIAQNS
jgi:Cys-tRNA(Pro)/Cys-tRNA(Cys) deacylase